MTSLEYLFQWLDYLLNAKDLAFCYALLRNDKIRRSDHIQEISEQCQSKMSNF